MKTHNSKVVRLQMSGFNHDNKFEKKNKQVKRLNDKKSKKKITNYFISNFLKKYIFFK